MGSKEGINTEKVVHMVTLDAFWIDLTEVTNGMYDLCVQARKCDPQSRTGTLAISASGHSGDAQYSDYPAIYVTWDKANAYCEWAGSTSGVTVRLPTEAEWEKATRGENGRNYPWGNDAPNCNLANFTSYSIYADNSMISILPNACKDDTIEVGSFPDGASPYGALDMVGNVWEWVADYYAAYPSSSESNPIGPSEGFYRMVRGGGWNIDVPGMYTFSRLAYPPYYTEGNLGFRCARPIQ
jgi:serine/threonine-protein kinase